MNYFEMGQGMTSWGPSAFGFVGFWFVALIVWSLVWKGLALWRAAKRGEKIWFVVFLLVNTLGILEIVYLFFITGAKLSDFKLPSASSESKND
ncbi:MAG: DUF5652 family protein [Patescibacteria group bacterium]|nr:DUF5652 family protein [bacterium]MDZ4227155.1 DUF5652 family protein [Patescibacteria group bacterium]